MGFMLKLNRETKELEKFNKILKSLPLNKVITLTEFEKLIYKYFTKKRWLKIFIILHIL